MKHGVKGWALAGMIAGFAFLYLPIVILVVFSFNRSELVTVWGGFSTVWYTELFEDDQLMRAAWVSISLALTAATIATVLGTMAGFALARIPRFLGRTLFSGMVLAPLVMPEVLTGVSLLFTFKSLGVPTACTDLSIGAFSYPVCPGLIIAHSTFSMCYVAVVVQSRLVGFDRSVEEAALDLGARPATVFWRVTLPLIAPGVIAGWLLSFTLSLDDVVIAQFVGGPSGSTLPVKIFSEVRLGLEPKVNAIATILIGLIATAAVIYSLVLKRALAKRTRNA